MNRRVIRHAHENTTRRVDVYINNIRPGDGRREHRVSYKHMTSDIVIFVFFFVVSINVHGLDHGVA